ncbi:hypoxanthine phosphoribosyltransferase [bacterium]|nr:hypoxanthine phosphoribosyltransferase [bacterium]
MNDIEVLFSEEKIQKRVGELGKQISKDYEGKELVVVGVLKGSFIFMADLVRYIDTPLYCDFLRISSYENDQDTGILRMEFDMTQPIAGKDVLLVEDIVDSGKTLKYLKEHLQTKHPSSLKVCSLLFKDVGTGMRGYIDYMGFEVPHKFVIGYGLDTKGLLRSLPYVGVFKNL